METKVRKEDRRTKYTVRRSRTLSGTAEKILFQDYGHGNL